MIVLNKKDCHATIIVVELNDPRVHSIPTGLVPSYPGLTLINALYLIDIANIV